MFAPAQWSARPAGVRFGSGTDILRISTDVGQNGQRMMLRAVIAHSEIVVACLAAVAPRLSVISMTWISLSSNGLKPKHGARSCAILWFDTDGLFLHAIQYRLNTLRSLCQKPTSHGFQFGNLLNPDKYLFESLLGLQPG